MTAAALSILFALLQWLIPSPLSHKHLWRAGYYRRMKKVKWFSIVVTALLIAGVLYIEIPMQVYHAHVQRGPFDSAKIERIHIGDDLGDVAALMGNTDLVTFTPVKGDAPSITSNWVYYCTDGTLCVVGYAGTHVAKILVISPYGFADRDEEPD